MRTHSQLRPIHRTAKKIRYRSLSSTMSKRHYLSGLYGRPRHSTQTVDYLYYSDKPKANHKKTELNVYAHTLIGAHKSCYHMNSQWSTNNKKFSVCDSTDDNMISNNFNILMDFSVATGAQPVACEVYRSAHNDTDHTTHDNHHLSQKITTWKVGDYLSGELTNTYWYDQSSWQNYVWICIMNSQEKHNAREQTEYAHNIKNSVEKNYRCIDPLQDHIDVINDPNNLLGYYHLFYAHKSVNRRCYRALDTLCSDYVYWVLSDYAHPNVAHASHDNREYEQHESMCANQVYNHAKTSIPIQLTSKIGLFSNQQDRREYLCNP